LSTGAVGVVGFVGTLGGVVGFVGTFGISTTGGFFVGTVGVFPLETTGLVTDVTGFVVVDLFILSIIAFVPTPSAAPESAVKTLFAAVLVFPVVVVSLGLVTPEVGVVIDVLVSGVLVVIAGVFGVVVVVGFVVEVTVFLGLLIFGFLFKP
jgi:hypothetical protein